MLLKQIEESQTLHKYQEEKHNYEARCGELQRQLNYSLHLARRGATKQVLQEEGDAKLVH